MRIQREAYERIAATIKMVLVDHCETDEERFAVKMVARGLAEMFKGQAPGFDVPRFLTDCGVDLDP